jgi:nicotinamidase-related amidase
MTDFTSLTASRPYEWPVRTRWSSQDTALLVIDMQADFLAPDGYFAALGNPLSGVRAAIEPTRLLIDACRQRGISVMYTREGHRPDLSDLHYPKQRRAELAGSAIGSKGPLGRFLVRGEPGWDIISELAPKQGEVIIDKPGHGAFHQTDLELILKSRGIQHLIMVGVTTEVCVHSTLREADDRGYDCLLIADACGAGDEALHQAAVEMTTVDGGIFGAVASSHELLQALQVAHE